MKSRQLIPKGCRFKSGRWDILYIRMKTKISLLPQSNLGKITAWLFIAFFLIFLIFQLLVASGESGGETFFSNIKLSILVILLAIFPISAFFTGLVAIIRHKERSILVFLAVLLGFFALIFLLGEFLFPH